MQELQSHMHKYQKVQRHVHHMLDPGRGGGGGK